MPEENYHPDPRPKPYNPEPRKPTSTDRIVEAVTRAEGSLIASQKSKSDPNGNTDRWYKKVVIGVFISVITGLIVLFAKYLLGL